MKQTTKKELLNCLKENGYTKVRSKGSHAIYSNGLHTISVPIVTLKAVVANRLMKDVVCNRHVEKKY